MNARDKEFEAALDMLLALRSEPAAPARLARHIVVHTAHLPQLDASGAEPESRYVTHARPSNDNCSKHQHRLGGAIAASLALLMFGTLISGPANYPATDETILPEVASEPTMSSFPTATMASAAPARNHVLAMGSGNLAVSGTPAGRTSANEAAPETKPGIEKPRQIDLASRSKPSVHIAAADAPRPRTDVPSTLVHALPKTGIEEFALAEDPRITEPVYGPVLEPEWEGSRFIGRPSAGPTSGLAFSAGHSGIASPNGGPQR